MQQDNEIAMAERPRASAPREGGYMCADTPDAVDDEWDAMLGEESWCLCRFAKLSAAAAAGRWIISDA